MSAKAADMIDSLGEDKLGEPKKETRLKMARALTQRGAIPFDMGEIEEALSL